jgi:hypothetical protein
MEYGRPLIKYIVGRDMVTWSKVLLQWDRVIPERVNDLSAVELGAERKTSQSTCSIDSC